MLILRHYLFLTLMFIFLNALNADCAPRKVYVKTAPPVARVEVKSTPPYTNAIWISGRWAWRSGKYVWVGGHWVKPRNGSVWVPGHWVKKRRGWIWIEGYWKKR